MFTGPRLLAVTVTALAAVTACSGNTGRAAGPIPDPTSPTPLTRAQVEGQVLDAWVAGEQAFAEAVRRADPNYQGLAQTTTQPLLNGARAFILAERHAGDVGRGSEALGTPHVVSINPWPNATTAVVTDCVYGGLILVNRRTGRAVPGISGEVTWNWEHATLIYVAPLGWMVSNNSVREASSKAICSAP